jgi:hypothetical protein
MLLSSLSRSPEFVDCLNDRLRRLARKEVASDGNYTAIIPTGEMRRMALQALRRADTIAFAVQ